MSYTPPPGNAVFFTTSFSYTPPAGNAVHFISGTYRDIAQWSELYIGTDISLSANKKTAWRISTGYSTVLSNIGVYHLPTYTELEVDDSEDINAFIGLAQTSGIDLETYLGDSGTSVGFGKGGNWFSSGGLTVNCGVPHAADDRIGFAVNPSTGKVWISVNGTYVNSGNPAAGTNATIEGFNATTNGPIYIGVTPHASGSETVNSYTLNDYSGDMLYAAPSGFSVGIDGYNSLNGVMPRLSGAFTGTSENPSRIVGDLSVPTGAFDGGGYISGNVPQPTGLFDGAGYISGSLPAITGALGIVIIPTIYGTLPAITGAFTGDTPNTYLRGELSCPYGAFSCGSTIFGVLPELFGSFAGSVGTVGNIIGSLSTPTGIFTGNTNTLANIVGTIPALYGAFSGTVQTQGDIIGTLPKLRGSFSGNVKGTTSGDTIVGSLPSLIGSFSDNVGTTETIQIYVRGEMR
jgi:hypothetical protein